MTSTPNFLMIGAQKAGTSAIYEYLKNHPEIYMSPVKEPRFFALEKDELEYTGPDDPASRCRFKTWENYIKLFDGVESEKAIGEASTLYHYHPLAPERILHYLKDDVKLIFVLRNPIDRAFSNYTYAKRDSRETLSFEDALKFEEERIAKGWGPLWHYKKRGHYAEQIERYYSMFKKENIMITFYDYFKENKVEFLQSIYKFLNVDDTFHQDVEIISNKSGIPRSAFLNKLMNRNLPIKRVLNRFIPKALRKAVRQKVDNANLKPKEKLKEETRAFLKDYYAPEIESLQKILNKDLPKGWYK